MMIPGGGEGDQVRHRSAAGHGAAGPLRKRGAVREPSHEGLFHGIRRRREVPEIGVLFEDRRDLVGVGRERIGRRLHVRQETRVRRMRGVWHEHLREIVE